MKLFLVLVFVLIHGCGCTGFAQTPSSNDSKTFEFLDSKENYIKNPYARFHDKNVTCVNATATRLTTSGNKLKGWASWTIDASAQNGYCEFALDAIRDPDGSINTQMELMGFIKGDGSLYRAQILDSSAILKNQTPVFGNNADWRGFTTGYPGQTAPKVRITQTEAGTAPAIQIGVYYGRATNIGVYAAPNTFTAKVNAAGVVSDETPGGTDWINGNCVISDTSYYSCTFVSSFFTAVPNCAVTTANATDSQKSITGASVTSSVIGFRGHSGGSNSTAAAFVSCTKTGADESKTVIRQDLPVLPNPIEFNSSGTYTPTPGVSHIIVTIVGAGGGGGGSGITTGGGNGGSGGATSFGSIASVPGAAGGGGSPSTTNGGLGSTPTVNTSSTVKLISSVRGGSGQGILYNALGASANGLGGQGGQGGSSCLGGNGGGSGYASGASTSASANSGSGGGGGAYSPVVSQINIYGGGGGAGGCAQFQVNFPSSTAITIGSGGTAGTAGTSGAIGGGGGAAKILIYEFFQMGSAVILPNSVPIGGASGQVLGKVSGSDNDFDWLSTVGPASGLSIRGTNTNNNACAGCYGEYISLNASGSTNPTVSGTVINLMSMVLLPGDWDVEANVFFSSGTATGIQYLSGGLNTVNNAITTNQTGSFLLAFPFPAGLTWQIPTGTRRFSLLTTTTIYLNATLNFSAIGTGTFNTNTFMRARRVR